MIFNVFFQIFFMRIFEKYQHVFSPLKIFEDFFFIRSLARRVLCSIRGNRGLRDFLGLCLNDNILIVIRRADRNFAVVELAWGIKELTLRRHNIINIKGLAVIFLFAHIRTYY
jgi:hypothetical protein